MPKRNDIKKILLIGSGPIVIGQACEFDYSGTQACKALKEEGYEVVLVNSNPATIMTDPTLADQTYVEPLNSDMLEAIIAKERPDAVLPTLGGQTALNLAMEAAKNGVFKRYNAELLGADEHVIHKAEDRQAFRDAMDKIGVATPRSEIVYTIQDALDAADEIGYPVVVRPAFTLGGTGGGIAHLPKELKAIAEAGIDASIANEILVEECISGWKEFELEVMRDKNDNVIIICSIENLDPMGVHTGDSITVAPAQTLNDKDYQEMRNQAKAIMREIGVETGGSNVQFAVNPDNGKLVVIEMNPRVSRSSALASKATGFPIAKLAAKLAVGYTLDELKNDITQNTPACFEPTLDYCVVKIPRFNFRKFPSSDPFLGTSMKAVGEVMAIGRTFNEALQKGIRSLEVKRSGLGLHAKDLQEVSKEERHQFMSRGNPWRLYYVYEAFKQGLSLEDVFQVTKIDPWFLREIHVISQQCQDLSLEKNALRRAKEQGFSDAQLAHYFKQNETAIRAKRLEAGIKASYALVDTCSAEFQAKTPYYYSTYGSECEGFASKSDKVMILGGGPNRIGQGIEFDYCCVHASMAVRDLGLESIMVNSNPETVSTDFDISDKLYFEPVTFEDVMNIYELEKPKGVIVQFGGQTPLNIAADLAAAGLPILGTQPEQIDLAEDREKFQAILEKLKLKQPENGTATCIEEAIEHANTIGYPVVVRPSYVLGGASMDIVHDQKHLERYIAKAKDVSGERPILIDQFLENAIEIDVDALADGEDCVIAGIMQHIEQAGVHSGDSACCLPPFSISKPLMTAIRKATFDLAKALGVVGLLNIQFAIKDETLYMIEVNPRASRTIPFVSKATGVAWAKEATAIMLGHKIKDRQLTEISLPFYAVKEAVLPFSRFPGSDILLSPEMKSTGEVMGLGKTFAEAFLKSQVAASQFLPKSGKVFLSLADKDKPYAPKLAKVLLELGFTLMASLGTQNYLSKAGIQSERVAKISDQGYTLKNLIEERALALAFFTPSSSLGHSDEGMMRKAFLKYAIPYVSTIPAMNASLAAIAYQADHKASVQSLQTWQAAIHA
eukprot:COSAG01_NODE_941_length_12576_cov_118.998557_9_plen_1068_part_00